MNIHIIYQLVYTHFDLKVPGVSHIHYSPWAEFVMSHIKQGK
jgi:hypothetical protein